jgi:Domain of unknown function (DUF4159)
LRSRVQLGSAPTPSVIAAPPVVVQTVAAESRPDGRIDDLVARAQQFAEQLRALEQRQEQQAFRSEPIPPPAAVEPALLRLACLQHAGAGWDSHRDAMQFLSRELRAGVELRAEVQNAVSASALAGLDVLCITGFGQFGLQDGEADAVREFLDGGGTVIGEGCAAGPDGENGAREFAMAFVEFGNRLGRRLAKVDRSHPLMTARYLFAEPPPGGRSTARLLENGGLVYSDADYGCAWQGGPAERPLARSVIRDALEFGVNLVVQQRRLTRS